MFFHASAVPNLKLLTPHISNHGKPLIYFSTKRENVLVYLSNAVEKYCKEIGFNHSGKFTKWASYGFTKDGILELGEYYPNATIDTYKGVSGFIYSTDSIECYQSQSDIPNAVITDKSVKTQKCEFIPDAYEAIMQAVRNGEIVLQKYEDNSEFRLRWIKNTIPNEYKQSIDAPDYQAFLKAKFDFLSDITIKN